MSDLTSAASLSKTPVATGSSLRLHMRTLWRLILSGCRGGCPWINRGVKFLGLHRFHCPGHNTEKKIDGSRVQFTTYTIQDTNMTFFIDLLTEGVIATASAAVQHSTSTKRTPTPTTVGTVVNKTVVVDRRQYRQYVQTISNRHYSPTQQHTTWNQYNNIQYNNQYNNNR